jgi:hypothetical protein
MISVTLRDVTAKIRAAEADFYSFLLATDL